MIKRNTKQRRNLILRKLEDLGEVHVDELAKEFTTSEVTIRKDLAALEEAGLLLRRYGGAMLIPQELLAHSPNEEVSDRKRSLAACASKLIKDHNRIIMDSGSTTSAMIPFLSENHGLVVMTNSIEVATKLQALENEPSLLMTGGTWDTRSESFQGLLAEKMLREYDFDQLFIGADGLDPKRGTTTYNEFNALSRTMAEVSREVIVLAESSKALRKIPNIELDWQQVSCLITDAELSSEDKTQIEQAGVRVMIAETPSLKETK